jgi:hypothetical protein
MYGFFQGQHRKKNGDSKILGLHVTQHDHLDREPKADNCIQHRAMTV